MDKIVYHFDPDTGELLGSSPIYTGPAGDEQVVAFATLTPPPEAAQGYVAVVTAGSLTRDYACSWSLVRDWRDVELYRTADGTPVRGGAPELGGWSGLGVLPATVTDVQRPSPSHLWSGDAWLFDLAAAKAAKLAEIDEQCAAEMVASFLAGGHSFSADPVSVASILAAGQIGGIAKAAGCEYSTTLVAADGAEVEFDADGLIDVALALGVHQDACRKAVKQLKDAVQAAGEESAIAAIKWPNI